jgi:hypothetical protein
MCLSSLSFSQIFGDIWRYLEIFGVQLWEVSPNLALAPLLRLWKVKDIVSDVKSDQIDL